MRKLGDENRCKVLSIGSRVMVEDVLKPREFISGVICSQPELNQNSTGQDFIYEVLIDFSDDVLFHQQAYKRIKIESVFLFPL